MMHTILLILLWASQAISQHSTGSSTLLGLQTNNGSVTEKTRLFINMESQIDNNNVSVTEVISLMAHLINTSTASNVATAITETYIQEADITHGGLSSNNSHDKHASTDDYSNITPFFTTEMSTNGNETSTQYVHPHLPIYNFIVNVVVDGILCILGFFGNILTIIVFQKLKKTSNCIILQALAVFDSLFLLYVVVYVVLRSLQSYTESLPALKAAEPYIVAFVLPLGWTSQTGTIWLLTVAAVDRYIAVSRPLKAKSLCTPKAARIAVTVTTLAAVLFNSPRWPNYYFVAFLPKTTSHSDSTFVSHVSVQINLWDEYLYKIIYHITLTYIFIFIIPLIVLVTLNTLLILEVSKADKLRSSMMQMTKTKNEEPNKTQSTRRIIDSNTNISTNNQEKENRYSKNSRRITVMIIVVVSIFIFCQLPDLIASIIGRFNPDPTIYEYYNGAKEMLLVFNTSCNFFIYLYFNRRFRAQCIEMFKCSSCCSGSKGSKNAYEASSSSGDNNVNTNQPTNVRS